ncbi:MAG: N-acetylmuramoyl-L-alanine amidase [Hyphomicrobiaceae bacterium]
MNQATATLASCGPDSRFVDDVVVSPNIGARRGTSKPRLLVLHYTGLETAKRSIDVLCDPACEVSCHYLIDDDGRVTQMVSEADRAWHAGKSFWRGEKDINSHSVGIEIQNPGHAHGYPDFPDTQMAAVERLALDIIARHGMAADNVLAHSDIAPQRKIDPGEKFDWRRLNRTGVGHWVAPCDLGEALALDRFDAETPDARVRTCQELLAQYGYDIATHGRLDAATGRVISAFQRHFRPARVDGLPDDSTIATLRALSAALEACGTAT